MSGIKIMYVASSACIRVRGGESQQLRVYSRVRQGFIMSPWLFIVYVDAMMKEVKMEMERGE